MERRYRDVGRASLGRADFDDYRSYGRLEQSGYDDYDPLTRESYLGSRSYRSERSGYDRDRVDIVDSLLQQRALQQQLNLRESQLALANSLLHQQRQQPFLNKRRMDPRGGDPRRDFKRPRLMDDRSRPRNPSTRGQDSYGRRRGSRGSSSSSRNPRASPRASHGQLSSDRSKSRDKQDPKKPAADEDDEGNKLRCRPCDLECKDEEELKKHKDTSEHKEKIEKIKKPYCPICDEVINNVDLTVHQRFTSHKKRQHQVTRGCTWCDVASFKNFTEVLEHRATDQHIKNQEKFGKRENRGSDSRRDSRGEGRSRREREDVKVHLPPELDKFNPEVVIGQSCVIDVTGWFCKLCNKFYNNETAAKETHCMTEPHFNNYRKFMYTKLKAKAKAERDAREKAAEEERKKKEAEKKKAEGEKAEPSSEQMEGDHKEMTDKEGEEQEGGEEVEENGMVEGEEAGVEGEEAGAEGEESFAEGEEAVMDEEEGEEMIGEPEEYVDDEEAAAEEAEGLLETQEGSEDLAGIEDVENVEGSVQEEAPQAVEELMEAEVEDDTAKEEEEEAAAKEEEEEAAQKKATRATVSSPGRGRGRGGASGRARRGRRVAK